MFIRPAPRHASLLACLVALVMLAACGRAPQSLEPVAGAWQGVLAEGPLVLPVLVHLGTDGSGSLDSPLQGAMGVPIADVVLEGASVRFAVPSLSARFEGTLSADAARLEGRWQRGEGSVPLALTRASLAPTDEQAALAGGPDGAG